ATVTSPSSGTVSGTVSITADSSDPPPGTGVTSVQFLVDGNVLATDTSAPYATNWDTTGITNGAHTIAVRATDGAGNATTPAPVSVTVDNVAPSVVVHVTQLTGNGSVGISKWSCWVDVSVADQNGQPMAGATVTLGVSGGTTTTRSCTTGADGTCSTVGAKVT